MNQQELNEKLNIACGKGDMQAVRYWLTSPEVKRLYGRNADIEGTFLQQEIGVILKPLFNACRLGHLEVVRYLLTSPEITASGYKHADIEGSDGRALSWACYNGHLEVVRFLLTSPEITAIGGTHARIRDEENALYYAAYQGRLEIFKYLLASPEITAVGGQHACLEAGIREKNTSALEVLCHQGHKELLNYLIFDYGLRRTRKVASITRQFPEIDRLFKVRKMHDTLSDKLCAKDEAKRTKV